MADETNDNLNSPTDQVSSDEEEQQTGNEPEKNPLETENERLKARIEELQRQLDSYKDQFLRKAAEFENFKRRTEAETLNLIKNANEGLISALLPTLNDFVRSLKAGSESKDYDAFFKGVELIYQKFSRILEAQGLVPFESVGKPFDVEYHDALLQMPKDDVPPHTVIEEIERGYMLNDKVLRHAKVIVSAAPSQSPESESQDSSTSDDVKDPNGEA